jgi:hypothetical protein
MSRPVCLPAAALPQAFRLSYLAGLSEHQLVVEDVLIVGVVRGPSLSC